VVFNNIVHTVVIGGDPLSRVGLRRILEDTRYHADVIAASIADVMSYREHLDLLLVLSFPYGDPLFLDALAELRGKRPEMRVVVISENHADQLMAALNAGAHGYLARHISAEALLQFLSLIVLGQRVFSTKSLDLPEHFDTGPIHEHAIHGYQPARIDSSDLTERERALLAFLVKGHSNKVIARMLGVAEATVKAQMARL